MKRTLQLAAMFAAVCVGPAGCSQPQSKPSDDEARRTAVAPPSPRDGLIPVGQPAPDFEAKDQDGNTLILSDLLKKQNVVLIFYPADFTPGCTKQLCTVRDEWSEFQKRKTIVLGVNPATVQRHKEFADHHKFQFPVINDAGAHISAGYGAKGKNPDHPERTVYVIRKDGKVAFAERGMVSHDKIYAALDRP